MNFISQLAVEHEPMNEVHIVDEIAFKCRSGYGWHIPLPDELDNEGFLMQAGNIKKLLAILNQ
ncbi:TPA: hypothetical protein ACSTJY_004513 [Serratia fonticola]